MVKLSPETVSIVPRSRVVCAFAAALRLRGDPYLALLDLGEQDDETLVSVLQAGGFARTTAP